jgi:hypothetical protein
MRITIDKSKLSAIAMRDIHPESLQNIELVTPASEPSFVARFVKGSVNKLLGNGQRTNRSLLEYTVSGYNLLADRDVEVEKQYDASGRVVAYHVNGELIKIGQRVNPPMGE